MKVFTNTTPLIALSSVSQLNLLQLLFTKIYTVESVREECEEGGKVVVPPFANLEWLEVLPRRSEISQNIPPLLAELGKGERDTIWMSLQEKADLVIIDDLPLPFNQ
ncbi:MAG: hypothetical protein HQM15_00490 [Deltaproteobacteria bacterium]|nr:hypothetical protein [Deltaproteobacteria bacterium]